MDKGIHPIQAYAKDKDRGKPIRQGSQAQHIYSKILHIAIYWTISNNTWEEQTILPQY